LEFPSFGIEIIVRILAVDTRGVYGDRRNREGIPVKGHRWTTGSCPRAGTALEGLFAMVIMA
jgi:hypothetical protein